MKIWAIYQDGYIYQAFEDWEQASNRLIELMDLFPQFVWSIASTSVIMKGHK